jgi:rRNA maturation protein Nop10
VSTKASTCPHCGAPFKAFMPKATGFKDFFSEDRMRERQRKAQEDQRSALSGCLSTFVGLIALVFLVFFALAMIGML